jgi:uncharacterized protein YneF (UPF0154 family)
MGPGTEHSRKWPQRLTGSREKVTHHSEKDIKRKMKKTYPVNKKAIRAILGKEGMGSPGKAAVKELRKENKETRKAFRKKAY